MELWLYHCKWQHFTETSLLWTCEDKMTCSNSKPTCKLHQGSIESSYLISSFSQNFGDELCYSQAPSYNKSPNRADFQNHTGSVVLNPCEATTSSSVENKCSKPSYEKNPIDKLLFMKNNYFTSLWVKLYKPLQHFYTMKSIKLGFCSLSKTT